MPPIDHLRENFEDGQRWLIQKAAVTKLQEIAEVGRSAACEALKVVGGRFAHLLTKRDDGLIGMRAAKPADDNQKI